MLTKESKVKYIVNNTSPVDEGKTKMCITDELMHMSEEEVDALFREVRREVIKEM